MEFLTEDPKKIEVKLRSKNDDQLFTKRISLTGILEIFDRGAPEFLNPLGIFRVFGSSSASHRNAPEGLDVCAIGGLRSRYARQIPYVHLVHFEVRKLLSDLLDIALVREPVTRQMPGSKVYINTSFVNIGRILRVPEPRIKSFFILIVCLPNLLEIGHVFQRDKQFGPK